MDINSLRLAAKNMIVDALREEASIIAGRASKIPKAERQGKEYKSLMAGWKVLRDEIDSRK